MDYYEEQTQSNDAASYLYEDNSNYGQKQDQTKNRVKDDKIDVKTTTTMNILHQLKKSSYVSLTFNIINLVAIIGMVLT